MQQVTIDKQDLDQIESMLQQLNLMQKENIEANGSIFEEYNRTQIMQVLTGSLSWKPTVEQLFN